MPDLKINGRPVTVDAPDDTPLLWVLREDLQLTGTKYSCGTGLCGACTVLVDGGAVRSCVLPVSAASGKEITTIEGLGSEGLHPLQQAWQLHSVPQCGFCQPGQIMAAAALLNTNKSPDTETIRTHMAGNLCRCGTYPRIERAIKSAAASMASRCPEAKKC